MVVSKLAYVMHVEQRNKTRFASIGAIVRGTTYTHANTSTHSFPLTSDRSTKMAKNHEQNWQEITFEASFVCNQCSFVHISIVHNDQRTFAAQLERNFLQIRIGRSFGNESSNLRRSGECDLANFRVRAIRCKPSTKWLC